MEKKEDRRIERTKESLRKTFKELVLQRGYSKVTVKDIVEIANYNRTTFYVHYEGKKELAEEIIRLEMERFSYEFCKPLRDNPILDLTAMKPDGTDLFYYIKENRSYYDLLVIEDVVPKMNEALLKELMDIFRNRMYFLGEKASEINSPYFTHYRAYGIYGFIIEWIRAGYDVSPSEMARRKINLLYYQSSSMAKI